MIVTLAQETGVQDKKSKVEIGGTNKDFLSKLTHFVLLIAGLGGNFSAGYDLGELAKIEKEDIANELVRYFSTYEVLKVQKMS